MVDLRYLDLFAGAGGLSEGFTMAGFLPVAHIELDKAACYTLKTRVAYHWLKKHGQLRIYNAYLNGQISRNDLYQNVPDNVLDSVINCEISSKTLEALFQRIDSILNGKHLHLIIGGPPCQAYSLIGRARDAHGMVGDERNYLYKLYAEFLKRYKPDYFVFENVSGLLSAKEKNGERHFDHMRKLFRECGYETETKLLNARNYGVLQNRKRLILIGKHGAKNGENFYPYIEEKSTDHYTVGELLDDLPAIHSGEGKFQPVPTKHYGGRYLFDVGIKTYDHEPVTFHCARPNNSHDLEIYRLVVDAWNKKGIRLKYTDLPDYLRTHHNIKSFLDRFKVVVRNSSYTQTVVAHLAKDGHYFIHPDITQNRSITPREAARIQTFPDNFYFESVSGRPSRTYAFKQIGNAVPVYLAYSIAKAIRQCFEHPDSYVKDTDHIIMYSEFDEESSLFDG